MFVLHCCCFPPLTACSCCGRVNQKNHFVHVIIPFPELRYLIGAFESEHQVMVILYIAIIVSAI